MPDLVPDTLPIILVGNKTDLVRTRQVTIEGKYKNIET